MSENVIVVEFGKRRVPDDSVKPVDPQHVTDHEYVIELEHEVLELQQLVCALYRDLTRARAGVPV
jgi:hypothetical protein